MCRVTCSGQEPTASLRVPFEWKPSKGGIVGAEAARSELPASPAPQGFESAFLFIAGAGARSPSRRRHAAKTRSERSERRRDPGLDHPESGEPTKMRSRLRSEGPQLRARVEAIRRVILCSGQVYYMLSPHGSARARGKLANPLHSRIATCALLC